MRPIWRSHRVAIGLLIAAASAIPAIACSAPDDSTTPSSAGAAGNGAAPGSGGVLGAGGGGVGGTGPGTGGSFGNAGSSGAGGQGTGGSGGDNTGGASGSGAAAAGGTAGTGAAGSAGSGTGGVGPGGAAGMGGSGGQTLPPISDYSKSGPFTTTSTPNTWPGGRYTIFRPEPLGQHGFLHSPLIWGPGIATQVSSYTTFLTNVASHGFVVVAVNTLSSGPGAEANRRPMIDGLDWIIAQNTQPGVFQGKLDVNRAVSMGYSIGGTAAVQVGAHPSVITTVSIHGHNATSALHGPLFQTTGTADTVGLPLQQQTYDASQVQTFLATLTGATHTEILSSGGGRERAPIVAWLRFWVYNDQGARNFFYGDACTLCVAPWTNPQRKNWQ